MDQFLKNSGIIAGMTLFFAALGDWLGKYSFVMSDSFTYLGAFIGFSFGVLFVVSQKD